MSIKLSFQVTPRGVWLFDLDDEEESLQKTPPSLKSAELFVFAPDHSVSGIVPLRESTFIGSRLDNDIVLPTESVEPYHAVISFTAPYYTLRRNHPRAAILVNGDFVEGNQRLSPGDVIQIDDTELLFSESNPWKGDL